MPNKDACETCKSTDYYYWRVSVDDLGNRSQYCSSCFSGNVPSLSPDVYFDRSKGANQVDPNLCTRDGKQIPFSSKREKAAILKQLGLREAGDKNHGARNWDKSASKQWE